MKDLKIPTLYAKLIDHRRKPNRKNIEPLNLTQKV